MAIRRITAPAAAPVTLVQAKAHLRVTVTDEDALIQGLIDAATQHMDGPHGLLGRAIVTQEWELVLDRFPTHEIQIPLGPLQSVESIMYDDEAGNEQLLSPSAYEVDTASEPGWVLPREAWPATINTVNTVRVRFKAGFGSAADVPAPIKQAILLMVGLWYAHREEVIIGNVAAVKLPVAAEALLSPHRRMIV